MTAIDTIRAGSHADGAVPPWRITVIGAGAIGGALAVRLAAAGHKVSVLARGATLAALREGPASLTDLDGAHRAYLDVYDSDVAPDADHADGEEGAAAIGPQDLVILAVKAQSLTALVPMLASLVGPNTRVMPAVNGVPWWYFHGMGAAPDGGDRMGGAAAMGAITALDPSGLLEGVVPAAQIVGTVVYMTGYVASAGAYVANNPHRLIIGDIVEGAGEHTIDGPGASVSALAAMFRDAGIATECSPDIRTALWAKLAGNLTSNPLSVLTGATLAQIYGEATLLSTVRPMLQEIRTLANALSVQLPFDDAAFLARCRGMGAVKTSMLQDAERGRPLELAAIGDAVLELAARVDVPMPVTASILGLVRHRVGSPTPY
ncbi:2-dehydropantoate 2-reductase [Robbsia sp. KACC 23696]|uniref:ketopantoate reductase family protein n=1 Tax=Robbsia sp. KACC 23696 TaxID=3149231 RepID=UPI00325C2CA3